MLLLANSENAMTERLAGLLVEVESRFASELKSDLPCVNQLVEHVERYRGKMLRPTLVLVSSMAIEPEAETFSESHIVLAAVVEMIHMATLVHDDVLDEADVRRRGSTINHLRGNEAAVMLGDYLISHAYHLSTATGSPVLCREIAAATNVVCEGELLQLSNRDNWALTEATYFEIIRRKTASLCGACCSLPARLLPPSAEAEALHAALYQYGEKLGVAFQVIDDLLDLTGDAETVGKTLGRDLEKGKLTLPVIQYLAQAEPAAREKMVASLQAAASETGDASQAAALHREIAEQLAATGALKAARGRAEALVAEAKAAVVGVLPPSPAQAALLEMADAVITRKV